MTPSARLPQMSTCSSPMSCQPVHSIDPDTAAPFGSVLKLYVLHALAAAVASGKVGWDQPLTVTERLKSLPSGVLQYEPDGTQPSVLDAATKMIAISDNTATDMLINLGGRSEVEAALTAAGMANPSLNLPFLTTRETFVLMLEQWPSLANRYLTANEAGRRALLANTVDRLPLPDAADVEALSTRGNVVGLGWLASASDICRAYASLAALAGRACPRSARCLRSKTTFSSSTLLSGRPPGARAESGQAS
jgi:Beta-lactamase enzyme family